MRFLPHEDKFYGLFLKQVEIISEASRLLLDGVRTGNARLQTSATAINVLEHRGDEVIHEIFTKLNQTFITPLDPEDIHSLSSALDDVMDGIEDTAHRLVSYRIDPVPANMVAMAEIVANCARALRRAFEALEKNHTVMEHAIEINRLENEADLIGRAAVADLFNKEKDPITLIKLKEVYDFFEDTIDSCEDVADVLQNVTVKNSLADGGVDAGRQPLRKASRQSGRLPFNPRQQTVATRLPMGRRPRRGNGRLSGRPPLSVR